MYPVIGYGLIPPDAQSMEAPLIIFLVLLLLVGPILGIIAFVGMRRLDEALRRQNPQELTGRIYALEQRL